jgi:hypothetical protein
MRFEAVMHVGCSHQGSGAYAWGLEEALQALWAFHSLQLSERTRRRKTGGDEFTESSFIKWPVCVYRLHWPWLHLEHLREIDAVICCCIAIAAWIHQVLSQTFCCWSSSFHWDGAKAQHIKRHQCVPTRGNWLMTDSRPAAVHRLPLLLLLLLLRFLSFPIPHHQRSETVVIWWQDFGNWCCCCYSRSRPRVTFQAWWKKKGLSRRDVDVLHTRVCRTCPRSLQRRQKRSKRQTFSDEDRQLHCTHKASIVVLLLDTIDATFFSLHAAAHSLRKSTFSLRTPIDNKHKTLVECASDDFFFETTKNAPGRQAPSHWDSPLDNRRLAKTQDLQLNICQSTCKKLWSKEEATTT